MPMLDDVSGYSVVRVLKSKGDSGEGLKEIIAQKKPATGNTVKRLKSENATELLSGIYQKWLRSTDIAYELSPLLSLEYNEKAERV